MTDSFTCRLIQPATSIGSPVDETVEEMCDWIQSAGDDAVDLIVFPELVTTGYHVFDRLDDVAERVPGPTTKRIGRAASTAGVHVLFGMPTRDECGTYHNAAVWIGRDGRVCETHLKRHRWGEERAVYEPGSGATVVETSFGSFGIQICYEANFPEASAELARSEVDAIVNISAWSVKMEPDWHILLPARALENGAYLLGCNLVGQAEGTTFCGRSKVVNPDGSVEAELNGDPGSLTTTLNWKALEAERDRNPMRRDRAELAKRERE